MGQIVISDGSVRLLTDERMLEEYRKCLYNFPDYKEGVPMSDSSIMEEASRRYVDFLKTTQETKHLPVIMQVSGIGENIKRTPIDPVAKWPEPEEIQEPKRWKSDIDKSTLDELKAGVANCWDSFRQRY